MVEKKLITSAMDESVNIITPVPEGGFFEARAVWRESTLIIYLSSMSGCDRACRMCHLTQTGQTEMTHSTTMDYLIQASDVFTYLRESGELDKAEIVHFNFMARGDVLSNHNFIRQHQDILYELNQISECHLPGRPIKFKLSTIFPTESDYSSSIFKLLNCSDDVEFYYSLYSLRSEFRKRWLPKAIDPETVGKIFASRTSGLRLHHALIAGENDSIEDVKLIHHWLDVYDLQVKFNLVRYNPYDVRSGAESSDDVIQAYLTELKTSPRITDTQIVSRVGTDAFASCGMFYKD